jgi:RNA polymerase sigma factor (sigma-70 family)
VSVTFGKLYRNWSRAQQANSLDAYVQTILMRSWLDETRRPWRRERVTDTVPDLPAPDRSDVTDRLSLINLLSELPPRRRAVVVLRFYFDLSVQETAERLGCSPSTVMNLSSQTLEAMRNRAAAINQMKEEISS